MYSGYCRVCRVELARAIVEPYTNEARVGAVGVKDAAPFAGGAGCRGIALVRNAHRRRPG